MQERNEITQSSKSAECLSWLTTPESDRGYRYRNALDAVEFLPL